MDPDGFSRIVTQMLDAGALIVLLPSVLLGLLLAAPLAVRWHTSRWLVTVSLVSIGAILAATFRARDVAQWMADPGAALSCSDCTVLAWILDADLWAGAARVDSGWLLNVALFVPAALSLTLATRAPWRVLAGLVVLSALIELVQDVTLLGAPDPADLIANSAGAAVGVGLGAIALRAAPGRFGVREAARSSRRRFAASLVLGIAFLAFGWLGIQIGADARRDELAADLEAAFDGTTAADIAARMATDADALFRSTSTWPMYLGRVGETDMYEGRYTTQFFGSHRCVTVRWTTTGFTLRNGSGDVCTVFRDRPPLD